VRTALSHIQDAASSSDEGSTDGEQPRNPCKIAVYVKPEFAVWDQQMFSRRKKRYRDDTGPSRREDLSEELCAVLQPPEGSDGWAVLKVGFDEPVGKEFQKSVRSSEAGERKNINCVPTAERFSLRAKRAQSCVLGEPYTDYTRIALGGGPAEHFTMLQGGGGDRQVEFLRPSAFVGVGAGGLFAIRVRD
jgi:hypothetical protein